MFPNIRKIVTVLLLTSVTGSSVLRANSSLRFVKTPFRSTMGSTRFNALVLMFIHTDVELKYDKINRHVSFKASKRMILLNPFS